jgi:hypothetical protein
VQFLNTRLGDGAGAGAENAGGGGGGGGGAAVVVVGGRVVVVGAVVVVVLVDVVVGRAVVVGASLVDVVSITVTGLGSSSLPMAAPMPARTSNAAMMAPRMTRIFLPPPELWSPGGG